MIQFLIIRPTAATASSPVESQLWEATENHAILAHFAGRSEAICHADLPALHEVAAAHGWGVVASEP